jgi:hypothetical protein
MAIFDRLCTATAAAAGLLCATAVALSSHAAAVPLTTDYECAPGAPVAKECVAPAAAFAPMAGVPMALPGPVPVVPAAPPLPVVPAAPPIPAIPAAPPLPVVPAGAPLAAAPLAAGAPVEMAAGYAGKGDPVGPLPAGAPVPGQPLPAGPSAAS